MFLENFVRILKFPCISYLYEEMNDELVWGKNDQNTFLYKDITLTVYFSKSVIAGICERRRETMIDCHIDHNSSWPYRAVFSSRPYIFSFSASQPWATMGRCSTRHLEASLRNWTYLDLRLQIEDWPLQDSPSLL